MAECKSKPVFSSYAGEKIPISFPYRDMGTIRESYREYIFWESGRNKQKKARQVTGLILYLDLLHNIVYFSAVMRKKRLEPSSDRFRLICLLLAGTLT